MIIRWLKKPPPVVWIRPAGPVAHLVPIEAERSAEEWEQFRGFIGTKHICDTCGAVVGDPDRHAAWHARP